MNEKKMKKSVVVLSVFAIVILMGIGTVTAYSYGSQVPEEIQFYAVDDDNPVVEEKEDSSISELTIKADVPFRIKYQDPYADHPLDIDIQPGKQLLTGDEAEAYLRYRKPN